MAGADSRAGARGIEPKLRHFRGLNGIRALSVLAIIAFHSDLSWIPGGYYGVDAFFVLSGFLITALLLAEWGTSGRLGLRRFWGRRARRLLPALFLLVAVVGVVMATMPAVFSTPDAFQSAFWTVFYGSNWYLVHAGVPYFSLSSQPSPWTHTWSLAIEEQFYLLWPIVLLVVLGLGTRRGNARPSRLNRARFRRRPAPIDRGRSERRRLHLLFLLACVGVLASAALMAYLAPHGYDARAYYGTDTRAQALLVGAAIAVGIALWDREVWGPRSMRLASGLAIAGVAGTAAIWATTAETSTFAFRGGFLAASLAAGGVVLGCVVAPRSLVVRLLELPPLPQLGRLSYGMYLWYWPILLVTSGRRLNWGPYELFVLRAVLTVAVAALSYELVEKPLRYGTLRRWRMAAVAPFGAAAALAAVFVSTLVPVGTSALQGAQLHAPVAGRTAAAAATVPPGSNRLLVVESATAKTSRSRTAAGSPTTSSPTPAPHTSTSKPVKVLLVGDSLAGSLGVGLALEARQYGVQLVNEGSPSCSVSMQGEIQVLWYEVPPDPPCDVAGNADSLLTTWRQWIDAYNPDVVVYLARGETFNQQFDGAWQNLGETAFDGYVSSRFNSAANVLGSRGAAVMFLTVPYFDSGVSGAGTPWPENNPSRVGLDNAIMRSVAEAAGGNVLVFDLNTLVSPSGQYSPAVGSVNVRCGDGVHFSQSGGIFVGMELAPELAALGQAHARSSPGGTWPGPLPPSTPTWFPSLPCQ
jgi:peptidoglycan/LPS O-acetylase OafA/YrhL/lysophospholipase L1-like esterase